MKLESNSILAVAGSCWFLVLCCSDVSVCDESFWACHSGFWSVINRGDSGDGLSVIDSCDRIGGLIVVVVIVVGVDSCVVVDVVTVGQSSAMPVANAVASALLIVGRGSCRCSWS